MIDNNDAQRRLKIFNEKMNRLGFGFSLKVSVDANGIQHFTMDVRPNECTRFTHKSGSDAVL